MPHREPLHVAFATTALGRCRKTAGTTAGKFPGVPRDRLGFLYVTDHFEAQLGSILAFLRETTATENWVGTVGLGVSAAGSVLGGAFECFDTPAVAVMVGGFPPGSFHVFPTVSGAMAEFGAATKDWLDAHASAFGVVHGDPRNPHIPGLLRGVAEKSSAYLTGGLTSSRGAYDQVADAVTQGGLSGVLFTSEVAVVTGLAQSCVPMGPVHTITECSDEHVVAGLDGRPAFEVFVEDLGREMEDEEEEEAVSVLAGIPIAGSDTGDYLARNLVNVNPEHGVIVIAENVAEGDPVLFCRRSRENAEAEMARMLESLKRRLPSTPKGGLYFTCVARGPALFGESGAEMEAIRDTLGDFPLVGFSANGEISNDRLYGYTGVLALFL